MTPARDSSESCFIEFSSRVWNPAKCERIPGTNASYSPCAQCYILDIYSHHVSLNQSFKLDNRVVGTLQRLPPKLSPKCHLYQIPNKRGRCRVFSPICFTILLSMKCCRVMRAIPLQSRFGLWEILINCHCLITASSIVAISIFSPRLASLTPFLKKVQWADLKTLLIYCSQTQNHLPQYWQVCFSPG